ncbi:uncharacterized protein LOC135106649 [Scylla paramamosain]|uniref:uncharacterized protein LOC135106649 n=1 Tax=Scylla paramamosain TaxID=85552 RepID=UPI0030827456
MAVRVRLPPPPQPPWSERGTEGRPCRLPVSPPSACRLQSLPPPSAAISCTVALRLHLLLHKPPPPADWVGRVEMLVSGSEFPPSCRPPLTGWRAPEPSPPPRSPLRIGFPLLGRLQIAPREAARPDRTPLRFTNSAPPPCLPLPHRPGLAAGGAGKGVVAALHVQRIDSVYLVTSFQVSRSL